MSVSIEQLARMDDQLRVYDVAQKGWEHEHQGLDFNIDHITRHLVDVIDRKDFDDPKVVREEIAPDSVQYGLRIGRWAGFSIDELLPANESVSAVQQNQHRYGGIPLAYTTVVRAVADLSRNAHDLDHADLAAEAEMKRSVVLKNAAGLLIASAQIQSDDFGFNLRRSFTDRLHDLRLRFKIPEPTSE